MAKKRASVRNSAKSNRMSLPVGVRIISVLVYVWAFFALLLGLVFTIGSPIFINSSNGQQTIQMFAEKLGAGSNILSSSNLVTLFVGFGIIFLIFALVAFAIGRGIWRGRQWARITLIVLLWLGALSSLVSMFQGDFIGGLVNLIIRAGIASYLSFSKKVKNAFR